MELMAGGGGHTGDLTNPAPDAEDAEPVDLISVGLPCLERGCLYKKEGATEEGVPSSISAQNAERKSADSMRPLYE